MIKLTTLVKRANKEIDGAPAQILEVPMLVNPEGVVCVEEGIFSPSGPVIIGDPATRERTVSYVHYVTGRSTVVAETVEEIAALFAAAK